VSKRIRLTAIACILMMDAFLLGAEQPLLEYRGVVTMQLLPAKVLRVNKIIEDPGPGTSYIGKQSILVEVEKNSEVMANWTVVNLKYFRYPEPKTITYGIFEEQQELTVEYHAVSVEKDGDLSAYINSP